MDELYIINTIMPLSLLLQTLRLCLQGDHLEYGFVGKGVCLKPKGLHNVPKITIWEVHPMIGRTQINKSELTNRWL